MTIHPTAAQAARPDVDPDVVVDVLHVIHDRAAAFYAAELAGVHDRDPAAAQRFLAARGVDAASVQAHRLGYAPATWTALTEHLRAAGHTDDELLAAGLAMTTRRGTLVDRFRDRVMLPVLDDPPAGGAAAPGAAEAVAGPRYDGGRVFAFLGRTVAAGRAPRGLEPPPKYLNSPDTALYRKGDHLYGLGHPITRRHLAAGAVPVLVEGPLDAIAVTAAGRGRHVGLAPCGTALTAAQVDRLAAAVQVGERGVVEAFDADPAGRAAALRAYPLLRSAGAYPVSARMPTGADPSSLARRHPAALHTALRRAADHPLIDTVVDDRLHRWTGRLRWTEGRVGAARDIAPLIADLPVAAATRQIARISRTYDIDPMLLSAEVVAAAVARGAEGVDAGGRTAARTGTAGRAHPLPTLARSTDPRGLPNHPDRRLDAHAPAGPQDSAHDTSAAGAHGHHAAATPNPRT